MHIQISRTCARCITNSTNLKRETCHAKLESKASFVMRRPHLYVYGKFTVDICVADRTSCRASRCRKNPTSTNSYYAQQLLRMLQTLRAQLHRRQTFPENQAGSGHLAVHLLDVLASGVGGGTRGLRQNHRLADGALLFQKLHQRPRLQLQSAEDFRGR